MTTLLIGRSSKDTAWAERVHQALSDDSDYECLFLHSHPDDGIHAGYSALLRAAKVRPERKSRHILGTPLVCPFAGHVKDAAPTETEKRLTNLNIPTVVVDKIIEIINCEKRGHMNWYLEVLKKYALFSGRARRKEYWYFILVNVVISVVLAVIDSVTGTLSTEAGMGLVGSIYTLAVLIPTIAVSVRRLHDTDRSGWWLLVGLIPLIGAIMLLVFMVQDGKRGKNRYGLDPKEATA